jgi:hypothetical protein
MHVYYRSGWIWNVSEALETCSIINFVIENLQADKMERNGE